MPDCWVRLVRTGNEFRPYRSFDGGVTWQQTGLITNAFASEMLIGLGVTSHDNDSGGIVTATGTFQGFTLAPVAPDVAVSAAASLPSLIAGNPLQYTISIVNQGSASASSVSVSDVLPAGVTYVSSWASIGSASESSGTVTWTAGTLAVGQSATLTINVTAAAAGTAVNTATATASGDSNLANNAASTSTTILPQPDVALAKTASVANTIVGSAFSYTLAVTNQGAGNSASVSVSDPLPAGVTYVTNSASAGTVSYSAGTLTWNLGAMASGQAATLTVNVTAATAGSKVNTALATATDDGSPLNNSSSATVTVIQPVQPQLGTPVYSGGTTTFGFSFASQADVPYTIQYATNLVAPIYWQTLQTTNGNGSVIQVLDPSASADPRYYRVIVVP